MCLGSERESRGLCVREREWQGEKQGGAGRKWDGEGEMESGGERESGGVSETTTFRM
jgi:hypothetical protein